MFGRIRNEGFTVYRQVMPIGNLPTDALVLHAEMAKGTLSPFGHQVGFKFTEDRKHPKHHFAARRGRIDPLGQTNQISLAATAAACQVNNLHLIRGLLGRDGCRIYQMNGQPTAQNTRECGADGDLPGFRNWDNPAHIQELAKLWNVEPNIIPHWAPPTHSMQIFRYCEQGSIKFLWISGTNPAVSLPDLRRTRRILDQKDLFVVVQDAFMTETASRADVVLPAAIWGEKTGCFTNVDRTVHLSQKAVEPPSEARSDLDIFLDYADRMKFRDRAGQPLIKWRTAEEAFEAWKECSRGRPCDYTGMTYVQLSGGSGIQWPCTTDHPHGTTHLYADGIFPTAPKPVGSSVVGLLLFRLSYV